MKLLSCVFSFVSKNYITDGKGLQSPKSIPKKTMKNIPSITGTEESVRRECFQSFWKLRFPYLPSIATRSQKVLSQGIKKKL